MARLSSTVRWIMEFNRSTSAACAAVRGLVLAGFCMVATIANAADSVKVANAWVRAPVPGQKNAAAYVELTSASPAALVAAGSSAANRAEMHTMSTEGNVMRMRSVPRIDLPAGQTVKLAPGGLHIMLLELKQPLKVGDLVPLTLSVQPVGGAAGMSLTTLEIQAPVQAPPTRHRH